MNQATIEILSKNTSLLELDLSLSTDVTESNKLSFVKIGRLISKYLKLTSILIGKKNVIGCYFTITPTGPSFLKDSIYVLILKLFKVPIIFHLHGNGIRNKYHPPYKKVYDFVFRGSDVIVLSEALAGDVDFLNTKKIHVLNNFTSSPIKAAKEISPKHTIKLGFLSNLRRGKGVHDLINIAEHLATHEVDFEVHIAGPWSNNEDRESFFSDKRLLENSLYSKIKFFGEVAGEEKSKFFQGIDVFIFPSFIDTFPLVLLESLSFGKPIICSDIGGMSDIATPDVGYIFQHDDPNRLDKILLEIKQLHLNPYYSRKSAAAINASLTLYTKETYSKKVKVIISEFLSRSQ